MKAYHLAIAAAAAGLFLATSGPASATPLAPASTGAVGIAQFDGAIEPVHYRRHSNYRRYHRPYYNSYYRRAPAVSFGFSSYPYYSRYPYGYGYPYRYGYSSYPYYGYGPSFSFGFRIP